MAKITLIQSYKEHLLTYLPAILITIVGFIAAYQYVGPAPPGRLVMATGQPEGAYHQFAQQYRDILASHGIELELLNTAGSIENLKLLQADAQGVMEQEVTKVSVPLSYAEELYHLRVHINLVQKKLRQIQRQQKS